MKEVKITVNGKEYKKTNFTGADWIRFLDYVEAAGDKPLSRNFFDARYDFISNSMKIDKKLLLEADLSEVTEAFKTIETGITSAFFGIPANATSETPGTQE